MTEGILETIKNSVIDGESEEVAALVEKALAKGADPLNILNSALIKGIQVVGDEYEGGNFYLPDLVLGAEAMETGLAAIRPLLSGKEQQEPQGRIIIGTVKGDLHDIGKNIVGTLLKANGFEVIDLGVDVSAEKFMENIRELKPDIVGLSALLTTTVSMQKDLLELLTEEGLRKNIKVIVGGAPVSCKWATEVGADGYGANAAEAVHEVKKLLNLE